MGNLAAMNQLAELVANRDDAPFPKAPDTMVLDLTQGGNGTYAHVRTGREGLASDEAEFATAFYGCDTNASEEAIKMLSNLALPYPGQEVTGFRTPGRVLEPGIISCEPFYTVRRTPSTYTPSQSTGHARAFWSYAGNLWIPILYSAESPQKTYAPFVTVRRDPSQETTLAPEVNGSLVFGEERVTKALRKYRPQ